MQGLEAWRWLSSGSDIDRHIAKPVQLLGRASPCPTLFHIRVDDKRCVSQRVDELVALHRMAHIEAGPRIVRRYQDELTANQVVALLSAHRCLLKAVCKYAGNPPSSVERSSHRSLVDASGST
ncbi:hypothetical protein D9M72_632320 [compost metagenome]